MQTFCIGASALLSLAVIAETAQAQPDAVTLLQGVQARREAIASGRLEMTVELTTSRVHNVRRLSVVFDGGHRLYRVIEGAAPRRALFDGEQAVAYDGKNSTTIHDPLQPPLDYLFDPRILGIAHRHSVSKTIEQCLDLARAGEIALVGDEEDQGRPVWHVRVTVPPSGRVSEVRRDFWISRDDDLLVYRCTHEYGFWHYETRADYDLSESFAPLPTRVHVVCHRDDALQSERTINIVSGELDAPVDPESFTLAGLEMAPGTAVVDERIHQRIGYWDGSGLSEQYPPVAAAADKQQAGGFPFALVFGATNLLLAAALVWLLVQRAPAATPEGITVRGSRANR